MDQLTAKKYFQEFLEKHPNLKPNEDCEFSELEKFISDDVEYYYSFEIDENGKIVRGAKTFYIFNDGAVLMPYGGSVEPEEAENVCRRWKNKEY